MKDNEYQIRAALPDDGPDISALAFRSKAHWGYDQNFMDVCRAELTYTAELIESSDVDFYVCERNDKTIAFYALAFNPAPFAELEAMFVEPSCIRRGLGRTLFLHAVARCESRPAAKMFIQADRFAAGFYASMGAKRCGSRESGSVAGRQLPVFEYTIAAEPRTEGAGE